MSDFTFADHGSIVTFRAQTPAALDWLEENVASEGWQYLGGMLCVEARYGVALITGIVDAGLSIEAP